MLTTNTRIEIPVHYDLWMRGARFGTISKIGRKHYHIKMDHPEVRCVVKIPHNELEQYGRIV